MTADTSIALSKGEQTRRAVLDAAIQRFGRDGFRASSVAAIARDAGVGGTVPYAYFDSKEALFLEAIDHDAAEVVAECLAHAFDDTDLPEWEQNLLGKLVEAVGRHPLAHRVLAGLEPDVTARVLHMSAITDLRRAVIEHVRELQESGEARADIDPEPIGHGVVAIVLSVLMSVVQVGSDTALEYGRDIATVLRSAIRTN